MEPGKKWKLRGIRLCGETGWAFSLFDMDRDSRLVRTDVLDNVETVTDVTGVTATTLDKYEEQTSVEPYYAKRESKLFAWLYSVVRDKKTLTDVEKTFCCVNIFAESEGKYDAWTQKAIVAVQSYGGSTKGLQLPYNIHWIGERTYGAAAITAGKLTFTPGSSALEG